MSSSNGGDQMSLCKYCFKEVGDETEICPYCGRSFVITELVSESKQVKKSLPKKLIFNFICFALITVILVTVTLKYINCIKQELTKARSDYANIIDTTATEYKKLETDYTKLQAKYGVLEKKLYDDGTSKSISSKPVSSDINLSGNGAKYDELITEIKEYLISENFIYNDWEKNVFFWDNGILTSEYPVNYDYSIKALEHRESIAIFKERSKKEDWVDNVFSYGVEMLMDKLIPFSSLVLSFYEKEETGSDTTDISFEVNYNVDHGKLAGIKQADFYKKIYPLYGNAMNNEPLTETMNDTVVKFVNDYVKFYEEDMSTLSTVYINKAHLECVLNLLISKSEGFKNEAHVEERFNYDMSNIRTSLLKLDAAYLKIKEYQKKLVQYN